MKGEEIFLEPLLAETNTCEISPIGLPFVGKELKSDWRYCFCFYRVMFLCVGSHFHKLQGVFVVYTFDYFVFIDFILQFIRSGIVTCRYVLNFYIPSLLVSKNWGLRLWTLYVFFLFCWFSRVNYVVVSVICVVICFFFRISSFA